jgi:hypothetical protein
MVKACIDKNEGKLYPSRSSNQTTTKSISTISNNLDSSIIMIADTVTNPPSNDYISNDPTEAKIMIGAALAFYSGLFQAILII